MNFSRAEFLRGALAAWLWFLILHQVFLLFPTAGYGYIALQFSVPWSFGALLVGSPIAFMIGRALRTDPRKWVHVTAFASFGLLLGVLTTTIALWLALDGDFAEWWVFFSLVAISASPAVALGWWYAASRALKSDEGNTTRRRVDPDSQYEDGLLQLDR
ncbi:hypothetical protein [Microbacterium esteraromaticum]|uniref:hypothetical protein n=1 Tax=Microbacterium esteraromaticum TaxID=57043 RepID=UPI0019D36426|nr:hypothetical protein [Microbacterium esteraromaticum]MBN7793216.1 hypothetical protein [Microbacterium esteraromaticum]